MSTAIRGFAGAAIAIAILSVAAPASAAGSAPDGTIDFKGGSVAFIAGVAWGGGTLHYKGKTYPLQISGLSVGEVGAKSYQASGEVYNLKKVSDIAGTYAAGAASATVAGGAGGLEMQNGAGVVIKMTSTSLGLNLKLGPSGLTIRQK